MNRSGEIYARRPTLRRAIGALGLLLAALLATSLLLARPAHADTFTVTSTSDAGAGSLRQAILDANANKGADVIKFNIPGGGVKTISPISALPEITGAVTINGYTQPGSRPNSRAKGGLDAVLLVEISGTGGRLKIESSNVVVRGLVINRSSGSGISIRSGTGSRIEGNFIGTDPTGTLDRGHFCFGVQIDGGGKHTVGGASPEARNLISGNNCDGVEVSDNSAGGNKVVGNLIGTQKDATSPLSNSGAGMDIDSNANVIGGAESGAANTIAFNTAEGIFIASSDNSKATGNRIVSNSIFSNEGIGINLEGGIEDAASRTANDPKDRDAGPNALQNFPVLTSAEVAGSTTTIKGTLDSTPSTRSKKQTFTIQFFSNPRLEDEGRAFLGQKKVTTNRQGKVSFTFKLDRGLSLSESNVTATATDARGNTSEFSDPELLRHL